MLRLSEICRYLETFAPSGLAEDWDNVGLLVGRRDQTISRIMTCLTVTPHSAAEAIASRAELIVSHHPLPFRPLRRITDESITGRILIELLREGISIYSPHTSFDSTEGGINQQLAELVGLTEIEPLRAMDERNPGIGAGRRGAVPGQATIGELATKLKTDLRAKQFRLVGHPDQNVRRVAVACGSAGGFLSDAVTSKCDLMITGETSFHTCLEAEAEGIGLLLLGHFASERFAVETLAEKLAVQFRGIKVWASQRETDPLIVV